MVFPDGIPAQLGLRTHDILSAVDGGYGFNILCYINLHIIFAQCISDPSFSLKDCAFWISLKADPYLKDDPYVDSAQSPTLTLTLTLALTIFQQMSV